MGDWRAAIGPGTARVLGLAVAASAAGGVLQGIGAPATATFAVCGVALALLASSIGTATEELSVRLGPGPTGALNGALGNLPELFVGLFALRQGLVGVVQAALVGSILGNSLLVLGVAFLAGGLRHGTQSFRGATARLLVTLTLLAVAALAMPTLASRLGTPANAHEEALSVVASIMLLVVFVAALIVNLRERHVAEPGEEDILDAPGWPLGLALAVLGVAAVCAAFVSDWFVNALTPAADALHISQSFTGLVIVALAGNAVEHTVGVRLMLKDRTDVAMNVILQSSLQIALALTPALVLLSFVIGGAHLTLALSPLLLAALALTAVIQLAVVYDGESTWIEGLALVGLYVVIAASFWWG